MNLLLKPIHEVYAKLSAKGSGVLQFSVVDVLEMMGNGRCAYSGKEFSKMSDITFERINPCKGYVAGNVVLTTSEANCHKSQLDAFVKGECIPNSMKVKLLRKAIYQLEKKIHTE